MIKYEFFRKYELRRLLSQIQDEHEALFLNFKYPLETVNEKTGESVEGEYFSIVSKDVHPSLRMTGLYPSFTVALFTSDLYADVAWAKDYDINDLVDYLYEMQTDVGGYDVLIDGL